MFVSRLSYALFRVTRTRCRPSWNSNGATFSNTARAGARDSTVGIEVDVVLDGKPTVECNETIARNVAKDAEKAARKALRNHPNRLYELSLVLCDDATIQELNRSWRGKDAPTDVLSFPISTREELEQEDVEVPEQVPVMLGDLFVSLDTALVQAKERGHGVWDETRVLLVHGILHLLGYDHEVSAEGALEMAQEEKRILKELGWKTEGLITETESYEGRDGHAKGDSASSGEPSSSSHATDVDTLASHRGSKIDTIHLDVILDEGAESLAAIRQPANNREERASSRAIDLIAVDLDGTLLNSNSRVSQKTAKALAAAAKAGIRVAIATGKARPAARVALKTGSLILPSTAPGLYLQGLVVHGSEGIQLPGEHLPSRIVRQAFEHATANGISLTGFLGDTTVCLKLDANLLELHERYHEPLAVEARSVDEIMSNSPVKKLLFMAEPDVITNEIRPYWEAALAGTAEVTQAVPTMLEILPFGSSKGKGLLQMVDHMNIHAERVLAIGDGENDIELFRAAGISCAMSNAPDIVKAAADHVVASNDEDGVVEALERFVL